ncbi:lytic murein transglycosylase [Roseibium hamelinense]|uniref:Lytic murein transglycosylase n=1 Tax=Roseibium hamelinense TaxID=150831 RepID=A0A562TIV2_9HYPH|nr:lytic murein transglycosylase [Roseibium hamelinense]MTI43083.1 lytic murein transglycosylase [Roseibium hamelinense]TWI92570.1 lytic murein transglycosylase [Roseibium hamelinense]
MHIAKIAGRATTLVASAGWCAIALSTPVLAIESCVASLKQQAVAAGVQPSVADKMLSGAKYDEKVIRFSTAQPEFKTEIWDYMAFLVDPQRIQDGKTLLRKHRRTLEAVEQRYGVDKHVVLAVWGIESDYGQFRGDFYTPHALANLVCAGKRRQNYFRGELIKTLQIASRGDVPHDQFQGSWAGAFGQTQFMPSTYNSLAVDFDGDGRKDLVNSVPDALASTANFLKNAGWRNTRVWGFEVKVPKGYSGPSGRKKFASMSTWTQRGLRNMDGSTFRSKADTALIRPAGVNGPAFLVTRNFNALRSYNASTSYGLAIALLSELVKGGDPIMTPWPTNNPGLSRAQRLELQKLLNRNGFDVGEPDGKVGPKTRAGIRAAEAKYGLPVTGRPAWNVYYALGGR